MLLPLDWRRRWLLRRAPPGPLRRYLETPLPARGRDYRELEYLALDLETTGLDHTRDHILSVGYVMLQGTTILLSTARHRLVKIAGNIPEASAVIHQITDDQAARGADVSEVLAELLEQLSGRVMIAHHARVERSFLATACKRLWGRGLPVRTIDTQALALRTFQHRQIAFRPAELRLNALAQRYNLPRYQAHNALSDALTAAELFIAQAAHRDAGRGLPLADFLC